MTKEEIMQLEGRELDKAVAKIIFEGRTITKQSRLSDRTMYLLVSGRPEEMKPFGKGKTIITAWWRLSEEEAWQKCPYYSSDISAAWEVEEVIAGMGHPEICRYMRTLAEVTGHKLDYLLGAFKIAHASPSDRCKAALLAVMEVES